MHATSRGSRRPEIDGSETHPPCHEPFGDRGRAHRTTHEPSRGATRVQPGSERATDAWRSELWSILAPMVRLACLALVGLLGACDSSPATRRTPDPTTPDPTPPDATTQARPGVVTDVWAGGRRTCVARDGEIRCWGDAYHGALGPDVTMSTTSVPTVIPGLAGATAVALGESHGCAVMPDATLRCWGSDEYGALGKGGLGGDSPTPLAVRGLTGVTGVAAHGHQTCALAGGKVLCWGERSGKLPGVVDGLTGALQISLGEHHACARTERDVRCWGDNDHGQLGLPDPTRRDSAVAVPDLGVVDEIAAAGDTTCARTGGAVRCWGAGADAQLGQPDRKDSAAPRPIAGLDDAVALALGPGHACALRGGGRVACWGGSDRGAFGFPRNCPEDHVGQSFHAGTSGVVMVYCAAPIAVEGIADAVGLVHGLGHACARTRAGGVRCWGGTGYGELGNRDHGAHGSRAPIDVTFPEPTRAGATRRAIAVGAHGEWSCAVLEDRTVRCWGASPLGQLGPDVKNLSAAPVAIAGIVGAAEIAVGAYHACTLAEGGGVRCWGYNGNGALGDGTAEARATPVTPQGLPEVTQLSASGDSMGGHTCALARDGGVWCWGGNRAGQAAPGGPQLVPPTRVAGLTASAVVAGLGATCAIDQGVPKCWGDLPIAGGRGLVAAPTPLAGLDHVVELGMGYQVICGRRDDGAVACWGTRRSGELKTITVPLGGPARALAVGSYGAAVVRTDGALLTWWIEEDSAPTEVSLPDVARVATSGSHTCALDGQGRVSCWGANLNGQLGNPDQGAGGESKTPHQVPL